MRRQSAASDTTLAYDRLNKAAAYARNATPEYRILNLRDRRSEVYRGPGHDAYAERILLTEGETVSPSAPPGLRVPIAALLP